MALVPIVCTLLAKMFEPTEARVQLKVQGWYVPLKGRGSADMDCTQ
jgi:hypothetical protein